MSDEPDLNRAYALETPDDSVALYRDWAATYDHSFAQTSDYVLHEAVARHFVLMGGHGPVLDVGAGTGLCGQTLRARGVEPIDGTDISPEMLDVARGKDSYRDLFTADVLEGLPVPGTLYQGIVSSGTFTNGHVGPAGIDAVLDVARIGAWVVISVNAQHYQAAGFAAKMAELAPRVAEFSQTEVAIYGENAAGPHADDTALLLAFRRVA